MPSALSKIESMAPYDTLKQCLDDPSGYERKIDARLRDNILVFLSHLKAYSPEMSLHKAQIYSRLNEYSLACQEYSKSISSVVESQSPICEDSLEVCYLSLRQHKALRKQSPSAPFSFLVLGDGLSCAKKDRSSASLKLAAQLFEESPEEFKVFFLDPTRRPEIAASLLPDLVYEMSADLKDEAFVRELAKHFLFSENPYSDSRELRQANFERYIASSAALSAEEAEFILTRYSPKESEDTETLDSERLNTLVLAAEKSLPGSPLYQVVQKLCLDSKLQSRRPKPLINYCQNHSEIAVAWRWIDLSSLSCQDHRVLVEMTWDLLDTTPELDLGSSYAQSFLSAVRLAYLKGDYDRAAILLARGCSPDHVLVENLKMMHDLRLETSRSPASLSQFIKRIQFLEKQTKRIQGLKAFNATTQKALQKQFYDLLVSTEEAMGQIAAKDTRVASRLEEFRSLFETWKKGVE